jgi:hypothetical protein
MKQQPSAAIATQFFLPLIAGTIAGIVVMYFVTAAHEEEPRLQLSQMLKWSGSVIAAWQR